MADGRISLLLALQNTAQIRRDLGSVRNSISGIQRTTNQFKNVLLSTFSATGAIFAVRGAVKTIADFESQMSRVKAITGANASDFKKLSDNAKELGRSTRFTATQVGELQEEYAKLGFSTKDILNASSATLDLAVITGGDLAQAATVAGSTLRAFGKSTKDTGKIVDLMAKSFTSSALDIDKFQTAMANVGSAAFGAGVPIEMVVAQLSALVDSGIDASTAGTSLRGIFITMAKKGLDLNTVLKTISGSTDQLATATQFFEARQANAAVALANSIEKVNLLNEAYKDVDGTATQMATEMDSTLQGAFLRLQSAIQGLILEMESSAGPMARFIDSWATFLSSFGDTGGTNVNKEIAQTAMKLATLRKELQDSNWLSNAWYSFIHLGADRTFTLNEEIDRLEKKLEGLKNNESLRHILSGDAWGTKDKITPNPDDPERNAKGETIEEFEKRMALIREEIELKELLAEINETYNQTGRTFEADGEEFHVKNAEAAKQYGESLEDLGWLVEEHTLEMETLDERLEDFFNNQGERSEEFAESLISLSEAIAEYGSTASEMFEMFGQDGLDFLKKFGKQAAESVLTWQDTLKQIEAMINQFIVESLFNLSDALGRALAGEQVDIGMEILRSIGVFLQKLGGLFLVYAVGIEEFKKSLESMNGYAIAIAGAAMIAAGAAIVGYVNSQSQPGGLSGSVGGRGYIGKPLGGGGLYTGGTATAHAAPGYTNFGENESGQVNNFYVSGFVVATEQELAIKMDEVQKNNKGAVVAANGG